MKPFTRANADATVDDEDGFQIAFLIASSVTAGGISGCKANRQHETHCCGVTPQRLHICRPVAVAGGMGSADLPSGASL
jgi:hypothetical protein